MKCLLFLPPEILDLIAQKIENMDTFISFKKTCKLINFVCKITIEKKKLKYEYNRQKRLYKKNENNMYPEFVRLLLDRNDLNLKKWIVQNTDPNIIELIKHSTPPFLVQKKYSTKVVEE